MTVVLVPGRAFGPSTPLLWYASLVFQRRGVPVRPLEWNPPPGADGVWVRSFVGDFVTDATLLVGKSFGTHAAGLAADRGLPGIWLTPLLLDSTVVDALHRAAAPQLLIGGTADHDTWDGTVARSLSTHVLEIEHGDHGLLVPGPLALSAGVLGRVSTAIENFADEVLGGGHPTTR